MQHVDQWGPLHAYTHATIPNMHACTHTLIFYLTCPRTGRYFVHRRSCIEYMLTNILSCASVVQHNDKVQRVSSEEAITGLHTSSPVSPAFCLSADAVKPSIFLPILYASSLHLSLWSSGYCCLSLIYCMWSGTVHPPILFNHRNCT